MRERYKSSPVLYFVPSTGLGEECLQNVHLQTGLCSEVVRSCLHGITYTAIPTTAKLSHTPYQNKRLHMGELDAEATPIACLLLRGFDQRETACFSRVETIIT